MALIILTAFVAAIYLALAVVNFARKRVGYGVARLFAAVLFGLVALFFAAQMRLF